MTPAANSDGSGAGRAVLLGASAGFDHDLLELPIDLGCGRVSLGEHAVAREDPMVRRDAGGELRQDVALSPLRHHDASGAEVGEFGGDLERADRAAGHQDTPAEIRAGPRKW